MNKRNPERLNDLPEIFSELLSKYSDHSLFYFSHGESLSKVCNAPKHKAGIYLVYGISKLKKELIYIGSSGHICNDGSVHVRSSSGGGTRARIVNGHHFNKEKRFICWPKQMKVENIDKLEVYWYVTHYADLVESPCYAEHCLLQFYFNREKKLPRWNKKF